MAAPKTTTPPVATEGDFSLGIIRDRPRHAIPAGGVYNATDYMLEQPGLAYKRGGWQRHSALAGSCTSMAAVFTVHAPTRVGAIGSDGHLYQVTSQSGAEAVDIGAVGFGVAENPPTYVGKAILCDSTGVLPPVKVSSSGGTIAKANLGGSPPSGSRSTIYGSRIVLARDATNLNRLWFSPLPNVESTWDTTNNYLDVTYEVIGLSPVSGTLMVFSPVAIERILGSIPPGELDENMELQPVASVGCLDARSIVRRGNEVIFAGEEGVWLTNGSGVTSLTQKSDRTGIQAYWRSLFPAATIRQITAGLLYQDYYIVSLLDSNNATVDTLVCYVPSATWMRMTNLAARMYAQGRTEQESLELFFASNIEGYVNKLSSIVKPTSSVKNDGNGTAVTPVLETRDIRGGVGLANYGHGHLTYDIRDSASDNPTIAITAAVGLGAPTYAAVAEGTPVVETTDVARSRFIVGKTSQSLAFKLTQSNASSKTEIYLLEQEVFPWGTTGDGQ